MLIVKFLNPPSGLPFAHGRMGHLYMLVPSTTGGDVAFVYADRLGANYRGRPVGEHTDEAIEAGTFHEVSYNSVVHGEEQQDEAPRGRLIFENFRINRWTASASMSRLRSFRASLRSDAREQTAQVDMPQSELRSNGDNGAQSLVDSNVARWDAQLFENMREQLQRSAAVLQRSGFYSTPAGSTDYTTLGTHGSPSTEDGARPRRPAEGSRLQESLRTLEENRQREQQRRNALSAQFSERY